MRRRLLLVSVVFSVTICLACLTDVFWYGGYDCCFFICRPDLRAFSWHWVELMTVAGSGGPVHVDVGWTLDARLGNQAVLLVWRVRRGQEIGWYVWISYWPVAIATALLPLCRAWAHLRRRRPRPGFPVLPRPPR